jgi:hypothetical protein
MQCYKDKIHCPFWRNCEHGATCHRALTDAVVEGAKKMNLDIDKYMFPPTNCFEERKDNPIVPSQVE